MNEMKIRGIKIKKKENRNDIFSFFIFRWREKWDEWKYEGSSFSLFGLIEKWDEWKYYVLKLPLYPHISICNLQI